MNDKNKKNPIYSANIPSHEENLGTKRVFIAGAGGLGSNVAVMLLRSGLTNMIIADFDVVNFSNLNRQYYFQDEVGKKKVLALKDRLLEINPEAKITALDAKLTPENFADLIPNDVDIIFECFDNGECKAQLANFAVTERNHIPTMAVSGIGGDGALSEIKLQNKRFNLYIFGDGSSEVTNESGVMITRVLAAVNLQVHTALAILLKDIR
ncbi:sulfur carrier protein ThiS adenylyltransferase ThiF [Lentisphaerota bacterium WC36G]|nr:sulfur carrier protein ThiS adenylyltransferase ThiF [Lentisphaerae bacterium WC36]